MTVSRTMDGVLIDGGISENRAQDIINKVLDAVYEEFEGMMIKDEVINTIQALKEAK